MNAGCGGRARTAVHHFVKAGIMANGDYALALLGDGEPRVLDDAERLEDAGVVECLVLALIPRPPQVDGGPCIRG